MYIIYYMWERYYFFVVFTFRKAIKNFEVKVNVQNRALRLEKNFIIDVLISSNSHFHPLLSYGNSHE